MCDTKIPEDGDMTINWDFVGFVKTNGSVRGLNSANSSSYKMTLQSVDDIDWLNTKSNNKKVRAVSPNADINGLLSYELPETSLFTGKANAVHWSSNTTLADYCNSYTPIGAKGIPVHIKQSKSWCVKNF